MHRSFPRDCRSGAPMSHRRFAVAIASLLLFTAMGATPGLPTQVAVGSATAISAPATSNVWASVSVADQLTGGVSHSCAIRTDSSLWCWRLNDVGQLGLGDSR